VSVLATLGVGFARAATPWTSRALLTLAAFAVAEYLLHQSLGITFGPIRALAASAILMRIPALPATVCSRHPSTCSPQATTRSARRIFKLN
jgi:hypothetical protein